MSPDYPAPAWRRQLVRVALLTIALLVAQVALTAAVDARGELGTGLVRPLVADDREAKLNHLDGLPSPPATLILGSSRMVFLDPHEALDHGFPNPTFNGAMRGGRLDDALAMFRYAVATQGAPEAVVIGIDPHQLSASLVENLRLHRDDRLGPHAPGQLSSLAMPQWAALSIIDPSATKDTYRALVHNAAGFDSPSDPFNPLGGWATAEPAPLEPLALQRWVDNRVQDYQFFEAPASTRLEQVTALVKEASAAGSDVHLWVTPEAPAFVAALEARTPYATARSAVLAALVEGCALERVSVHDAAMNDQAVIEASWFTDGEHLLAAASPFVWETLASGAVDLCSAA